MRTNGLTSAASALRYWERRQEIVANNLANVDTSGFKAERVFARAMGDGLPAVETATDLRGGTLTQTGAPLDVALDGKGFLVVDGPHGERLTRRHGDHAVLSEHRIPGGVGEASGVVQA